ncbi:class I SAM-dependent methyltransferase [Chitinophaga filiformis]|uniref:Methyltransferase domain-containing protein n=1 Tax=Chitinophaga filiformis TaxID=104663 RepID=A0A1G8BI46_CHIFI|nr:class I SAM-dependent methyltransferase [Chitinophaga filiformis]SDH32744.1 Methyltransferase domain-containing protein [Chitinophaga filiformis]
MENRKSRKNNVFETYNIIAAWFSENRSRHLIERTYLDKLINIVGKEATVLDLGCGTGVPIMEYLLEQGLHVTGVDASYRILEIAQQNLPSADFILSDMRELSLNRRFDAVIAWHSFFHLPAEDQPSMFNIFKEHLNKNGVLLFTSGKEHGEAWSENGGENLFHASLDRAQYQALLEEHGFSVLAYEEDDPECSATVWMAQLTQK